MARVFEPTPEQLAGWAEWKSERPPVVKRIADRFDPWTLYRLKTTGQRVTLQSISENGTVTIAVTGEYNAVMHDRAVFGIDPNDLEECDLPAENELVGTALSQDEVMENLDAMRVLVRPDLWQLDANCKAVRKQ